ncbi:hypothetical protein CDL12_08993 [Handroanthus impetiginosus]|uniref:B box-type domain-containing protein n=1 Tax=Handroanthus impetiginosus TaxID=429701 RepID=A0A2G9HLM2_9LAMI|nr:hypothetical protein CDL12_08993 [Handroanthus impetiginosus]
MCKTREKERQGRHFFCSRGSRKEIPCELCSSEASLYCLADNAFLCEKCDTFVHGANFLSQRHIRCSTCRSFTQRCLVGTSPNSLELIMHGTKKEPNDPFS